MENKFDISNFVNAVTEQSVIVNIVERVKKIRKELKLSQNDLAKKSGVSFGSIRRFEETGSISFFSLLKIANALNCLEDFNGLFKGNEIKNLKDYKWWKIM